MGNYRRLFSLGALLAAAGCESDFDNARRVASFNEAGKVLVSLSAVQDFRDPRQKSAAVMARRMSRSLKALSRASR